MAGRCSHQYSSAERKTVDCWECGDVKIRGRCRGRERHCHPLLAYPAYFRGDEIWQFSPYRGLNAIKPRFDRYRCGFFSCQLISLGVFLCACVRFFQVSASVAEIFLRKVKVGAHVKSRRWCKYGQRCGVRSEQRFRHVQRPHPPRSTALSSIVTTVASNREILTPAQPGKEAMASACFVCRFGLLLSLAKGWCSLSRSCTCGAFLGVLGQAWFISGWRHHFRLSRDVERSRRATCIAPSIAGPCRPSLTCLLFPHWESFSWSLPKPARLCKVSAFRRVGIQAIKSCQKKWKGAMEEKKRNFGSDSRKYCG